MFHLTFNPETGTTGEVLWGLPRDVSTFALYLNLDLIAEAGAPDPRELEANGEWDWDAFLGVADLVSALGGDIHKYGGSAWWGPYGVWMNAAGGGSFNADRTACNLDSSDSLAGLQFAQDLYLSGSAVPYGEDPEPPFRSGNLGMFQNGRWATPGIRTVEFDWDVVGRPTGPAGNPGNWLFWGAYVVNADTEHPEEAWKRVQALTTASVQGEVAGLGANIPSRVSQEALDAFLWRPSRYGQEQYHNGVLGHDASPGTGYRAMEKLHAERARMADLEEEEVQAEIALIFDYDDLWSIQIQTHRQGLAYLTHFFRLYRALQMLAIPVDILPRTADLPGYRLVVAPQAHIGDPRLAASLQAFVKNGGTLLMTMRSGFKTPTNLVVDQPLPAAFQDLLAVKVKQWFALAPGVGYGFNSAITGLDGKAEIWAEALEPAGAEPLAMFVDGPFAGMAGLTVHHLGAGHALYLGWHPTLSQALGLFEYLAETAGVTRLVAALDHGLLAYRRGKKTLLLNFSDLPREAQLADGLEIIVPPMDLLLVD